MCLNKSRGWVIVYAEALYGKKFIGRASINCKYKKSFLGNLKPRLYCKKQQVKAQELCPDRAS